MGKRAGGGGGGGGEGDRGRKKWKGPRAGGGVRAPDIRPPPVPPPPRPPPPPPPPPPPGLVWGRQLTRSPSATALGV